MKPKKSVLVPVADVQRCIHSLRGQRVMLDADLARFYGVATREWNRAVARNRDRFPEDLLSVLPSGKRGV